MAFTFNKNVITWWRNPCINSLKKLYREVHVGEASVEMLCKQKTHQCTVKYAMFSASTIIILFLFFLGGGGVYCDFCLKPTQYE